MDYGSNYYNDFYMDLSYHFSVSMLVVILIYAILSTIAMWKIYTKAGKPGWSVLIPIYNTIVLLGIIKLDWWHIFIILFVPFASLVYFFLIPIKLAKVFGKSTGFGVFTAFFPLIGYLILAFEPTVYQE